MTNEKNPVILTEEDYQLLKQYCLHPDSSNEEMSLAYELSRAIVVKKEAFPEHCIRLGSRIVIQDQETQKTKEFAIEIPGKADIKTKTISILTPMAAAVIGFRKGEEVIWKVPGGMKKFLILDVSN